MSEPVPARPSIGPREVSRILGIHENTVRNWTKEGRLTDVAPQGYRFHKYDLAEIEQMRGRGLVPPARTGAVTTRSMQIEIEGFTLFVNVSAVPHVKEVDPS